MNIRLIMSIVSFCLAMSGVFLGNMFMMMIIGEINRKRTDGMSYFGFTPSKMIAIFKEYRKSYPKGRLHVYFVASFVLTVGGMAGTLFSLCVIGCSGPIGFGELLP